MLYILYIFRTSFSMIHIKELRINTVSMLYIFQGDIKEVKTQLSQLKISMTLPVLSYRLSTRSNHSAICLLTWPDLMRSSRFTWMGRSNAKSWLQFHSIHVKARTVWECHRKAPLGKRHPRSRTSGDLGEAGEECPQSISPGCRCSSSVPGCFEHGASLTSEEC